MTIQEFIRKHRITSDFEWTPNNPAFNDDVKMNHYKVTLRHKGRQMTVRYSKGIAHTTPPSTKEVLESLLMDLNCVQDGLEEFVDSLGYKYHEGKRIYNLIIKNTDKLLKLLDVQAFNEFKDIEAE